MSDGTNGFGYDSEIADTEQVSTNLKRRGVHTVKLVRISPIKTKTGSKKLAIVVNGGGEYDDIFYTGVVVNKKGGNTDSKGNVLLSNKLIWQPLMKILNNTSPSLSNQTITVKDDKEVEIEVFDFNNDEIKIAVDEIWSDYHSEYQAEIVRVFNKDGFTSAELGKVDTPSQIDKYNDGTAWKAKKSSNKKNAEDTVEDEVKEANNAFGS